MPDTAVNFNGAYLRRATALTGAAATNKWTFSAWVRPTAISGPQRLFEIAASSSALRFGVTITGAGLLNIFARHSGGATLLSATGSTILVAGTLYHIVFSVDISDPAKRHVYINRAAEAMSWDTYSSITRLRPLGRMLTAATITWFNNIDANAAFEGGRRASL